MPPPLIFIILSILCFLPGSIIGGDAPETELEILLDLATSLGFEPWSSSSAANIDTPCNFSGVSCNTAGSVTEIDISGRGVAWSTIPFHSICRLLRLSKLALGNNNLTGEIDGLRNCTALRHLDLAFNKLSGAVPDLSPLAALTFLNLSDNQLTGRFPWGSLSGLAGLEVLNVGDNGFDPSPFPEVVTTLRRLTVLCLYDSNLYGEIPASIGNLTALVDLELSDNSLSGDIPPEIARLNKLWMLELYNNSISGAFPPGFGNLTGLAFFDASMNLIEGDLSELRTMTKLVSLQLYINGLSGEIPEEFGAFGQLANLSLYDNHLTGIPATLGSSSEFVFIDVSNNSLTGAIPPDMCRQGTMKKLLVLENRLSGEIPASYGNCTTLTRFRVNSNSLSGEVPAGIWSLPNVNIIDLAGNRFEGPIGGGIGDARSLYQLHLANNRFSGEIPPEIAGAASLVLIDASSNALTGSIPAGIGDLKNLGSLNLRGNSISGEISASIGRCASLNTMDLSRNSISGQIPASIGFLPSLNSLDLSDNRISGEIPASFSLLKLSELNLSGNLLAGPVPVSLAIAPFNESFEGNPELCINVVVDAPRSLRRCGTGSAASGGGSPLVRLRTLLACVLVGIVALAAAAIFAWRRFRRREPRLEGGSWDVKSFRVLSFDEKEILDSIRPENLVGKGGSGSVYRVSLASGEVVAVKLICSDDDDGDGDGDDPVAAMLQAGKKNVRRCRRRRRREFEAEVGTLSSIRHVNVVKLYCSVTCDRWCLLVYEHLPNGSLWDRLHTCEGEKLGGLDWDTRVEVAIGAARGLAYLHHGCDHRAPILHRDVKSSNILLDENFRPRIADFGLSKVIRLASTETAVSGEPFSGTTTTTHVIAGTHGYIAPEYGYTWKVDEKSDVYSFGVVLLELVTGRRPIEAEEGYGGESKDIVGWVARRLGSRVMVMGLLDGRAVRRPWEAEEALRMLRVAVLCTARSPGLRPTMHAVVQMLEEVSVGRPEPFVKRKAAAAGADDDAGVEGTGDAAGGQDSLIS